MSIPHYAQSMSFFGSQLNCMKRAKSQWTHVTSFISFDQYLMKTEINDVTGVDELKILRGIKTN